MVDQSIGNKKPIKIVLLGDSKKYNIITSNYQALLVKHPSLIEL